MEDERKKRGSVWPVLIVLLLVGYPASLGPLKWIAWKYGLPDWVGSVAEVIYSPIAWLMGELPWFDRLLRWWVGLWIDLP